MSYLNFFNNLLLLYNIQLSIDQIPHIFEQNPDIEKLIVNQKSTFNGSVNNIKACGYNEEYLLLLDSQGDVQFSSDQGFTFTSKKSAFIDAAEYEIDSLEDDEEFGIVRELVSHEKSKNQMVFVGTHGFNWQSKDCGKTVQAMNHGRPMENLKLHPIDPDYMLASVITFCDEDEDQDEDCYNFHELFVTKNGGDRWESILNYVDTQDWAIEGIESVNSYENDQGINTIKSKDTMDNDQNLNRLKTKQEFRIIASHDTSGKGHQQIDVYKHEIDIVVTDDYFKTTTTVLKGGNKFIKHKNKLMAARPVDTVLQTKEMFISDISTGYTVFYKTEIPMLATDNSSYYFIGTSAGQLMLNIRHHGQHEELGNVQTSDSTGTRFNLSLVHNVMNAAGTPDVAKVEGMTAVQLANYWDSVNESSYDLDGPKKLNANIKTVISFNRGAVWKPVKWNSVDSLGNKIKCKDANCSLHLHIFNSDFGPVQSTKTATGIIIANGNVGYKLESSNEQVSTWISTNGGSSFQEVRKGGHIYEIGDHGSLIVMADDQLPTKLAYFSWNQGASWETIQISDEDMLVTNIYNDPDNKKSVFFVYGHRNGRGVVHTVDLSRLHEAKCRPLDNETIGSAASDFEWFTPHVNSESGCVLGRKTKQARRKQFSQCRVGHDFERVKFKQPCECSHDDQECDLGFYRDQNNHEDLQRCKPFKKQAGLINNYKIECAESGNQTQQQTQGYRKIAGDMCTGGLDQSPKLQDCPNNWYSFGSHFTHDILNELNQIRQFLIGLIILLCGSLFWMNQNEIRTKLKQILHKNEYKDLDAAPNSFENFGGFDDDKKLF